MSATKANAKRLTPRERAFLFGYVEGKTATDAYLAVRPEVEREAARVAACRMLKRLTEKIDWPRLLEEAGLGDPRLLREIEARLNAVETKFWKDDILGEFEDNGTRQRATELLARLLGRDKAELTLHHDIVEIVPAPRPEDQPEESPDA